MSDPREVDGAARKVLTSVEGMERVNMLREDLLRTIRGHVDSLSQVDAAAISTAAVASLYGDVLIDAIVLREGRTQDPPLEVAIAAMNAYPWASLFGPVLERRVRARESSP